MTSTPLYDYVNAHYPATKPRRRLLPPRPTARPARWLAVTYRGVPFVLHWPGLVDLFEFRLAIGKLSELAIHSALELSPEQLAADPDAAAALRTLGAHYRTFAAFLTARVRPASWLAWLLLIIRPHPFAGATSHELVSLALAYHRATQMHEGGAA